MEKAGMVKKPYVAKNDRRNSAAPPAPAAPVYEGLFLQRKASCACGGGCPSCNTGLKVSNPNDAAEIEADRIADRVMRMAGDQPLPVDRSSTSRGIQRKCSACEEDDLINRKVGDFGDNAGGPGLSSLVRDATGSGGRPLDRAARRFFEPRFGYDFSSVRIHTGGQANAAARAVNASAYTLGSDIVFASGLYTPGSADGNRLLAHELAHVIQQDTGAVNRRKIHRAPDITGGKIAPSPRSCSVAGKAAAGPTAKDAAALTLNPSKNGSPCACLLVVHNNERNARLTAEKMHENCSYNLAMVEPDTSKRCVKLPSHAAKDDFDPNEFFDPDIVKQCVNDEGACKDHLKNKADSTDPDEIDRFIQINYFMTVKECSNSFSLPVIALHNNAVNDTKGYRDTKAGKKVEDLKMDIEKGPVTGDKKKDEAADELTLKPLKDMLVSKFDANVKKKLTEETGKTNIFRWCASEELSACHIGDPDRPDNVTWVTNREDFDKLKVKNVNVALQNDPARLKAESMTDLSTLFLTLKTVMGDKLNPEFAKLASEALTLGTALRDKLFEKIIASFGNDIGAMITIDAALIVIEQNFTAKKAQVAAVRSELDKYNNLHFINIEGPGYSLRERSNAERIESYDIIVETLKTIGLHCCGVNEKDAEDKVRQGLTIAPAKKKKP